MLPSGSGRASLALRLNLVVVVTLQHGWPPLTSCCAHGLLHFYRASGWVLQLGLHL